MKLNARIEFQARQILRRHKLWLRLLKLHHGRNVMNLGRWTDEPVTSSTLRYWNVTIWAVCQSSTLGSILAEQRNESENQTSRRAMTKFKRTVPKIYYLRRFFKRKMKEGNNSTSKSDVQTKLYGRNFKFNLLCGRELGTEQLKFDKFVSIHIFRNNKFRFLKQCGMMSRSFPHFRDRRFPKKIRHWLVLYLAFLKCRNGFVLSEATGNV